MRMVFLLLASGYLLGCASAAQPSGESALKNEEQQEDRVLPPPPADQSAMVVNEPSRERSWLHLRLTYAQRIIVPRGSELIVTVKDAAGKGVFARKTKTKQDAPPYLIEVPIKSKVTYPLKVDAGLLSVGGQRFSESVQVDRSQILGTEPVGIELKAQ